MKAQMARGEDFREWESVKEGKEYDSDSRTAVCIGVPA